MLLAFNRLRFRPISFQIAAANQNWINLLVQQSEGPFHQQTFVSLSFATHLHFNLFRFFSWSLSPARFAATHAEFWKYEHSYKSIKPANLELFLIFRNFHDYYMSRCVARSRAVIHFLIKISNQNLSFVFYFHKYSHNLFHMCKSILTLSIHHLSNFLVWQMPVFDSRVGL